MTDYYQKYRKYKQLYLYLKLLGGTTEIENIEDTMKHAIVNDAMLEARKDAKDRGQYGVSPMWEKEEIERERERRVENLYKRRGELGNPTRLEIEEALYLTDYHAGHAARLLLKTKL